MPKQTVDQRQRDQEKIGRYVRAYMDGWLRHAAHCVVMSRKAATPAMRAMWKTKGETIEKMVASIGPLHEFIHGRTAQSAEGKSQLKLVIDNGSKK